LAEAKHLNKECLDGIDHSAERLWRRYGKEAGVLLAMINEQPDLAEEVIIGSGVLKAEVKYAADHEMVVTMDDFLRRRTNLSLCHRLSKAKKEMSEIAEALFGNEAVDQLHEYQQAQPNTND
jgi:glycerol-3-phosphate dehydrogenase